MAFLRRFAPDISIIAPILASRQPADCRPPAVILPITRQRRIVGAREGVFTTPDTAKALNGAQGLSRAFYGGEGKIHEKNPKIQKTNQTKSQKTQKPRPFLRARQKIHKENLCPEQNRTEPNRTEPNRSLLQPTLADVCRQRLPQRPRRQMTCFLQPLRNLPQLRCQQRPHQ